MSVLSNRALRLLLVAGAILAVTAGVSYATALATRSASSAVIHGCYLNKIGTLRVIDPTTQHCLAVETPIQWNQTGPPGLPGPKGDSGAVSSLNALNGVPCNLIGRSGLTMVSSTTAVGAFNEDIECVTADAREPNDTRATERAWDYQLALTLYPAGDEDWFVIGGTPFTIMVTQWQTGADSVFNTPIHIEIYADGALAASGDGTLAYSPSPGHTYEVHVSGSGPALYYMQAF